MAIRPSIRYIDGFEQYLEDLANGEICLALGWSGDVFNAAARAREARRGNTIKYNVPKEGAVLFFDMMAIPADAPHPRNAHLFINYMMRPEVSARNSSLVHYATANAGRLPDGRSAGLWRSRHLSPAGNAAATGPGSAHSAAYTRLLTRMWSRFKSGH